MSTSMLFLANCAGVRELEMTDAETAAGSRLGMEDSSRYYAPLQVEDLAGIAPDSPVFWAGNPPLSTEPCTPLSTPETDEANEESVSARLQVISGYRIQIFAGREQRPALAVKKEAENRFKLPVYLAYEAPQYKIRIGDFITREEATEFCQQVRAEGFRDAWIVKSNVQVYR